MERLLASAFISTTCSCSAPPQQCPRLHLLASHALTCAAQIPYITAGQCATTTTLLRRASYCYLLLRRRCLMRAGG